MNDTQLQNALNAAAQNSRTLNELLTLSNQIGFNCPDAKEAARLAGMTLLNKGANEATIVSTMGQSYEAVLFTALNKAGRANPPDQAYANRIAEVYNQIVRLIQAQKSEHGRTPGNGTNIFTTNNSSNGNMFSKPATASGNSIFAKPDGNNNAGSGSLFAKAPANNTQETTTASLFDAPASDATATNQAAATTDVNLNFSGNNDMESLIHHETEVKLRSSCVTSRQVTESLALYKDIESLEFTKGDLTAEQGENKILLGKRTAIDLTVVNHLRTFEIGEGELTQTVMGNLSEEVVAFINGYTPKVDADFTARNATALLSTAIKLHKAFEAYAIAARESDEVSQLTVVAATRAATAVTTELYRALTIAIGFASEDKGLANPEGTGFRDFDLDYTDFEEEATQLEEFFTSYDGKQSSMFELIFCQFARALSWMRIRIDGDNVHIGRTETRVEIPYPILDNAVPTSTHTLLNRAEMGDNIDLLTDIVDMVDKNLKGRIQIIDGLYRVGYVDRAYPTCRPKIVLN